MHEGRGGVTSGVLSTRGDVTRPVVEQSPVEILIDRIDAWDRDWAGMGSVGFDRDTGFPL